MEPDKLNRNSEKFSLVDTVAELAQNREFTKGYDELVKRLRETHGDLDNCLNERTFLWYSLSALGNLISETIYENVLNYVNNVANINVCKVKALDSICQVLGVNSKKLLRDINNYPPEVIHLIDLFSINHDYLYNKDFLDNPSYVDLYYKTTDEVNAAKISELADNKYAPANTLSNSIEKRVFNKEKYERYVHDTFYNLLVSNIKAKYSKEPDEQYILSNLRAGLNASVTLNKDGKINEYCISKENLLDTVYVRDIENFKKKYDIDPSFDAIKIADKIENGLDYIENYNSAQLSAINLVFDFRSQPYKVRGAVNKVDRKTQASPFDSTLYDYQIFWVNDTFKLNILPTIFNHSTVAIQDGLTKYAYYKEKKFIDYVLFIDKINSVNFLSSYLYLAKSTEYELDKTYREITKGQEEASLVIKTNTATSESIDDYINYEAIENVATFLTSVSLSIIEIREKLKTQAQRHHMRGTYLLLSYVINEYLKRNLPVNYPWIKQYIEGFITKDDQSDRDDTYSGRHNVDFIEYTDLTEYYNLSTDTTPYALNGNKAVVPFWKDDSVNVAGVGLALNAIEDFYLRVLGLGQEPKLADQYQILSSQQFLSVIFDLGADRSYIDQYSKSLVLTEQVDELDIEAKRNPELRNHVNALSSYQSELFLKFRGTEIGYRPFYNYKNVTHSSHQIHPYLLKFIERTNSQYAVRNAFYNDANEVVEKALGTPAVSAIIGKCGNILNLWKNDAIDLTGWRSRYETGVHTLATNDKQISPLTDFDGVFYPSAIEEYEEIWHAQLNERKKPAAEQDSKIVNEFDALLTTVSCRVESKDYIDSLIYHLHNQKESDYWETLAKLRVPSNLKDYAQQISASYLRLSAMSEDDEGYDDELSKFSTLSANIPRTFYDKWYSHLTLTKRNAEYIACQLCAYQNEISAIYSADSEALSTALSGYVNDVYKYSLDQYGNSLLLYKWYHLSSDYDVKLNKEGQLWMRLNSHPIGFPMFGGDFPQAMTTNILLSDENDPRGIFRTLSSTVSESDIEENTFIHDYFKNLPGRNKNFIYDMDFSSDYKYGILYLRDHRYDEENPDSNLGKSFLTIEPLRKYARDAAEFEEPYLYMIRNANTTTVSANLGNIDDYEFNGFFRHGDKVYAPLLKYSSDEKKLYGKIVKYPYIAGSNTYKIEEAVIDLPNTLKIDPQYIGSNSQFKLGHAGGSSEKFKLVFTTETVENASVLSAVNTYIGESTTEEKLRNDKNDQGNYTELDEIAKHKYGIADYAENPKDLKSILREDHIHNSLDEFTQYIGIADFDGFLTNCKDVKLYNLNSDASYIPLYSGLRGMIRVWVDEFYRKKRTQSLELLGYEFKHLSDIESIISTKIFIDETNGTYTSDDPSDFLYGVGRIYEQYKLSDHFYMELNPALKSRQRKPGDRSDDFQYYWSVDSIPSSINEDTISNFYILIFNAVKGAMAPIASCPLSDLTKNPVPTSCITYLSTMTDSEEFFLSHRYLLPYISKIIGTTDVIGEEVNENNRVQVIGSNSYFNISALSAELKWNESKNHFDLGIIFRRLLSKGKDGKCIQEKYINEKFFDDPHPVPGIVDGEYLSGYPEPPYTKELTPPVPPDKYIPAGIDENNEGVTPYAKLKMGDDYIIDANSFVVMLYDLNLGQYENYHMLYHHDSWPYDKPKPPISKHSKITEQHTPPSTDDPDDQGTINTIRLVELNESGKAPVLFGIDISDDEIISNNISSNNNTNPLLSDEIVGTNNPNISKLIDPITGQQKYVLSHYYDFKEVDYLSGGTIAFKVSEQSDPELKYPTTLVNSYMFDVLKSTNKNINEISNVFDLSNTYVFELDSPKRIADIIGTVDINIYDDTEQCIRVDESYISDMYSISKFDSDLIPYIHFCTDDVISPNPTELNKNGLINAIKNNLSSQNEVLDKFKSCGYVVRYDEDREGTDDSTTVRYTVTEEDIKNFMKLYVNYERTGDSFTLYFNYNNFIMSPFMYRRKDGSFHPEYKPYTYLKLAPGENGILEVDVQIQYFNEIGLICGTKDVQCLTYKIFNVSDDKPKFVITRTWTLTKSRASVIKAPQKKSKAIMDIGTTYIAPNVISGYMNDNYTTDRDLTATVHVAIDSNIEISSLTCDFVYDYSDPYIDFVINDSKNANFQERGGLIHTNTTLYTDIYLNFMLKKGAAIDEKTFIREIPIDAINFKARDIYGVNAETTVNPGGIIFDFGDGEAYGKYLAKETNTPNGGEGFIPSENDKLIRIFQNKNLRILSRNPEFFKLPR